MLWLLVIGACHAFLIWFGDILATYALIGFWLILFARRKSTTLLVWTIVMLLLPLALLTGIVGILELAKLSPEATAEVEQGFAENREQAQERLEAARVGYAAGGYREILPLRARQVATSYSYFFFGAPGILAMFLLGLNLGRRRFFHDPAPHLPIIRRWIGWLFVVGLAANALMVVLVRSVDQIVPSPAMLLQQVTFLVGGPALCFAYVGGIVLLAQRESWRRLLMPLAAVGRMALTNYLMHSLVFTTLANGYGGGLYGKVSPSVGLLLTLAMFAIQIPLSNAWLRRFRFGPVEWLWRSLTYLRLQPMRR
jgi:uncharacterized protein